MLQELLNGWLLGWGFAANLAFGLAGDDDGGGRNGGKHVDVVDGFDGGAIGAVRVHGVSVGVGCGRQAPEFSGKQPAEAVTEVQGAEAGGGEGGDMVREPGGAEAGEQAEGGIEQADDQAGGEAEGTGGWDAEVREKPESAGGEAGADGGDKAVELGGGEAI